LDEFSPIGRLFTLDRFFEMLLVAQILGYFFHGKRDVSF
jgi:hypothetical protein